MRLRLALVALLLLAGCVTPAAQQDAVPGPVGAVGAMSLPGGAVLHNGGSMGALSYLHHAEGPDATVTFPEGVLVYTEDDRLVPATEPVTLARDALLRYLPPYGLDNLTVTIEAGGESTTLDLQLAQGERLVSGDLAVELMKVQRDQFPHRTPGMPNYAASMAYFEEWFASLGYEVETSEYPEVQLPVSPSPGLGSLSSVVAYKRGTMSPERYIVFGGHFDVVEETVEGAFDNTAGTIATLALAKAFANVTTDHTLVFAAWGGEEDGILGSQAWVSEHPELVPFIDLYVNYDVTAIAWPAPLLDPAPVNVATGPDGPLADVLAQQHQAIEATWMRTGGDFVYESVAQGQAAGSGVAAQSDHTPFMSRGVPVVFQFTARVEDVFGIIHSDVDTIENMTKYSLKGPEGIGAEFTAEEMAQGEAVLARSFETQMVAGFYWAVLVDNGVLSPARPAPPAALPEALGLVGAR